MKLYNASDRYWPCTWVIACIAYILPSLILIISLIIAEQLKEYMTACTKRDGTVIG